MFNFQSNAIHQISVKKSDIKQKFKHTFAYSNFFKSSRFPKIFEISPVLRKQSVSWVRHQILHKLMLTIYPKNLEYQEKRIFSIHQSWRNLTQPIRSTMVSECPWNKLSFYIRHNLSPTAQLEEYGSVYAPSYRISVFSQDLKPSKGIRVLLAYVHLNPHSPTCMKHKFQTERGSELARECHFLLTQA